MGATTAKVGSHATHRMVKRESERMIHQVAFMVPIIATFLGLEGFAQEAPGPLPPAIVRQQTTVSESRPAESFSASETLRPIENNS